MMKSGNMKEEERKRKEGRKKEGSLGLCLSVHRTKQKAEGRKPSRAKKPARNATHIKKAYLIFFPPCCSSCLVILLSVCLLYVCMFFAGVGVGAGAGVGVVRRGEARRGVCKARCDMISVFLRS